MITLPPLKLSKDQERRLLAGHLWIYSNEINHALTPLSAFKSGDLAIVVSSKDKKLGIAYVNSHTLLCARMLTRDVNQSIEQDFFTRRLSLALSRRKRIYAEPYYRWIFGESDELPGLVLDRFGDVIVGQINTAGMDALKPYILTSIIELVSPKTVLWRNDSPYRELEGLPRNVELAYGECVDDGIVKENDCEFIVSFQSGQKTSLVL
jgi:23S rRNA (cytosine1962-C5)-methyltransferase